MSKQRYQSLEEHVSKLGRGNYAVIKPYKLPLKVDGRISQFDITYFEFGPREQARRYLVISQGTLENAMEPIVRINSECMWGRLESAQCDCEWQYKQSKKIIDREGLGMIILGVDQIGKSVGLRGHSLINSEANLENPDIPLYNKDIWYKGFIKLGGKLDYRNFDDMADILVHYGLKRVRLLSNNNDKIHTLERYGIQVERVRLEALTTKFNRTELKIKKEEGGHLLRLVPQWKIKAKIYATIGLLSLASFVGGLIAYYGIQYQRTHRYDNVNVVKLEESNPGKFKDYVINGPEEGPKFDYDLFDQKWFKIRKYLENLWQKDKLSGSDIKKLKSIIESPQSMIQGNIIYAIRILANHTGDIKYLEYMLSIEDYGSNTTQVLKELISTSKQQ